MTNVNANESNNHGRIVVLQQNDSEIIADLLKQNEELKCRISELELEIEFTRLHNGTELQSDDKSEYNSPKDNVAYYESDDINFEYNMYMQQFKRSSEMDMKIQNNLSEEMKAYAEQA